MSRGRGAQGRALARAPGLAALRRARRGRARAPRPRRHRHRRRPRPRRAPARAGARTSAFVALHGRDGEDGTVQELLEVARHPLHRLGRRRPASAARTRCSPSTRMRDAGHPDARLLRLQRDGVQGARRRRRAAGDRGAPRLPDRGQAGRPGLGARASSSRAPPPTCPARSSPPSPTTRRSCSSATSTAATSRCRCSTGDGRCRSSRRSARARTSTTSRRATRSGAPTFVCPAAAPRRARPRARRSSRSRSTELLGCAGFARVDLMLDEATGELHVLEANAIPG